MLEHLYVDSTDLTSFGAYIFDKKTWDAPHKIHTFYDVPGRDGSVLGAQKRLENINVDYFFVINSNVETNLRSLRSYLLSRNGYVRIEDSFHTDEYRIGVYEGPMTVKATSDRDKAKGVISFNCKPQRFLKSGETATARTATGEFTMTNPTRFPSKPLVRIYGYGVLRFTTANIDIVVSQDISSAGYPYIDFDCETGNAYYYSSLYGTTTNLNRYVGIFNAGYYSQAGLALPTLKPGNNTLDVVSGTITKAEITPRWWNV